MHNTKTSGRRILDAVFDAVVVFDLLAEFMEYRAHRRRILRIRQRNPGIHPTVLLGKVSIDRNVHIGEGTYIRSGEIVAGDHAQVHIGRYCAIGKNVAIRARTHDSSQPTRTHLDSEHPRRYADIVIGDRVWIGDNVFVREGVTIGDDAIIGANAVVTHDVPQQGIAVGVPARLLTQNTPTEGS